MKLLIFLCIFILPLTVLAQKPNFAAFGQISAPMGDFSKSRKYDASVDLGYGGGFDLNLHINENLVWMTSLTFSTHNLNGKLKINDRPLQLKTDYSFYNLPALTGLLYETKLPPVDIGFWVQAGLNYAEFPAVSGTLASESSLIEEIDTIVDGQTNFGYSLGAHVVYKQFVCALRYMNFGDYTFPGTYNSSKTAMTRDIEFTASVSFLMLSLGYYFDLLGER